MVSPPLPNPTGPLPLPEDLFWPDGNFFSVAEGTGDGPGATEFTKGELRRLSLDCCELKLSNLKLLTHLRLSNFSSGL